MYPLRAYFHSLSALLRRGIFAKMGNVWLYVMFLW